MVQCALDASVLENVTFDLPFLSKYSLNSLLHFILNSSNSLFTIRIGNSPPPFPTHTLPSTPFLPPALYGNCSCQTLWNPLPSHSCSLWYVHHPLRGYPTFSLHKVFCSLFMILSSTSLFWSCFCHIFYKSISDFFPMQEGITKWLFFLYIYIIHVRKWTADVQRHTFSDLDHLFHSTRKSALWISTCLWIPNFFAC